MKREQSKNNKGRPVSSRLIPRSAPGAYFLINQDKRLAGFDVQSVKGLHLFKNQPYIDQPVMELISSRYSNTFRSLLDYSFNGNFFNTRRELRMKGGAPKELQLFFTPVIIDSRVAFVLVNLYLDAFPTFKKDISFVTSHQLRAPLSNILSLSDLISHPKLMGAGYPGVRDILVDINHQARQLDSVLLELSSLISLDLQKPEFNPKVNSTINHIMLVDDDPMVNRLHQNLLSKYSNKKIVAFTDALKALDYIAKTPPDLLFLDLNMPMISGFEFLEKLQQKSRDINVIIVSSSIDTSEKLRASTYDIVKDFLSKPLTYEKIEELLV